MLPTLQLKQVPLDAVLLSLKELPQTVKPVAVNNDPPAIFHADRPASLVVFDGDPVLAPAGNSGLKYAVNTNWDVFFDPAGKGTWYPAEQRHLARRTRRHRSLCAGQPAAGRLRASCRPTPTSPTPARRCRRSQSRAAQVPSIFVSTKPAEIIVTDGPPQFAAVPGTGLQYVKNTASDLFFDKATAAGSIT